MTTMGDSPTREIGLVDADLIDQADATLPGVRMALLYEQPLDGGVAVTIVTFALDCKIASLKPTFAEVRDSAGNVLEAQAVPDQPFEAIDPVSNFEVLRLVACDNSREWSAARQLGPGKTAGQIRDEFFPK